MTAAIHVVESLVERQLVELFASYGVGLSPVKAELTLPSGRAVAGVIGFASEPLKGTLVLAGTFKVMAASRPRLPGAPALHDTASGDWLLVRDWAAELSNQLLGRVKNRLSGMSHTLRVSTPTALSGQALSIARPRSKQARHCTFSGAGGTVWLLWDATYEPGFTLRGDEASKSAREGELIFF